MSVLSTSRRRCPLRVVFVNENVGGHATVHHHLRTVLADRDDVEAHFLHVPPASLGRKLLGAPVPGLARLDLDLQPLRAQLAAAWWVRRALATLVRAVGPVDALHVYTHNAGLLSVGLLREIPTVVTLDTTNALNAYRLPYRSPTRWTPLTVAATVPFERRVYAAARCVVANSQWAARSLREDYGVPGHRTRLLPFGVVAPAFEVAAAPGTTAAVPRLVFVGRQLERKGGLRLLRLFSEHFADRAELVLVTNEPVPPTSGVTVVDDLRPGDGRLWDILRDGSVFVFPSEIDQAPNAVLEAMAAGLPVVALATGAVGEMVADGVTGAVVPLDAGDAVLAEAIAAFVDDPVARTVMGAAGRARFEARYDMGRAVASLLDLLASVAGADGMENAGPIDGVDPQRSVA